MYRFFGILAFSIALLASAYTIGSVYYAAPNHAFYSQVVVIVGLSLGVAMLWAYKRQKTWVQCIHERYAKATPEESVAIVKEVVDKLCSGEADK